SLTSVDFPTVTLMVGPMSTLSQGTAWPALCCATGVVFEGAGFLSAASAPTAPSTRDAVSAAEKIARPGRDSTNGFLIPSPLALCYVACRLISLDREFVRSVLKSTGSSW